MRTPAQTAEAMIKRYGRYAEEHCTYAVMNNDRASNPRAAAYWRDVIILIGHQRQINRTAGYPDSLRDF
jgi:acetyl-CoA acetyltransferase